MRSIVIAFSFLFLSTSAFAQVRDLFAEFDEETKAAETVSSASVVASSSNVVVSSSSVAKSSSSAAKPSSSSVVKSSSSVAKSSSSAAVSSSSVAASSSSVMVSSSSVAVSSSSASVSSSSVAISSSSAVQDYAAVSSSSAVADSIASDSTATDSTLAVSDSLSSSSAESSSSAVSSSSEASSSSVTLALSSSSISRRDILGPTKVSKVYGMDEMKGKYKSPRKALFFSLVVPGAGQMYVGGSTFNYVRGAAYLAIEGALWGSWYYYSVYKYNRQVRRYKKFAKENFSAYQYETKMHDLRGGLDDSDEEEEFVKRYLSSRETYCKSIYGNAETNGCYTGDAATEMQKDKNHVNHMNSDYGLYNANSFYSTIAGSGYVLGWNDVENEAAVSALDLGKSDVETVALGVSDNQLIYRDMRSKANDYADLQAWFFGGLILNHVVSALDAAWSAHAHNKVLYEEELSWFDRLHLDGGFTPMNSRSTVNVYFNF